MNTYDKENSANGTENLLPFSFDVSKINDLESFDIDGSQRFGSSTYFCWMLINLPFPVLGIDGFEFLHDYGMFMIQKIVLMIHKICLLSHLMSKKKNHDI